MLFVLLLWLADPQQAASLLQQGLVAMQRGQNTEARSSLEKASQADDKNPYVWSSLAELYRRLHETTKSSAAAERAEKLGGSNPLVCHALAMYYSQLDQPLRAAPLEQKFAESERADAEALSRAASLYLAAGNNDRAYALAQQAVEQHPSPASQGILGRVLLARGQEQDALPYLRTSWEATKSDQEITFAYVNALLHLQAFGEAVETVTAALSKQKPDAQLELLLGVALYGQRRFDDSIQTFLKVIQLDPEVEQPYLFLGRLLEQSGSHLPEIVKADTAWAAANPKNAKAQLELAKALLQQDHSDARVGDLLQKAVALNPGDWESHYQLSLFHESKRNFAAASEELQKSISLDSKQPMPHYHLARVYDRLGKSAEAEAERAIHTKLSAIPAKDRQ